MNNQPPDPSSSEARDTPWRVDPHFKGGLANIVDKDSVTIAVNIPKWRAERIVAAINDLEGAKAVNRSLNDHCGRSSERADRSEASLATLTARCIALETAIRDGWKPELQELGRRWMEADIRNQALTAENERLQQNVVTLAEHMFEITLGAERKKLADLTAKVEQMRHEVNCEYEPAYLRKKFNRLFPVPTPEDSTR